MKKPNAEQIEANQDRVDRERAEIIEAFPLEIRVKALLVEEAHEKLKKANIDFLMLTPGFMKDRDPQGLITFYGVEGGWSNEKGTFNVEAAERYGSLLKNSFNNICSYIAYEKGKIGGSLVSKEKIDYLEAIFNGFIAYHKNIVKEKNDE